ncbi:hypothetical protein CYMTET_43152, partial [Cymbomonas tetramitiformis]
YGGAVSLQEHLEPIVAGHEGIPTVAEAAVELSHLTLSYCSFAGNKAGGGGDAGTGSVAFMYSPFVDMAYTDPTNGQQKPVLHAIVPSNEQAVEYILCDLHNGLAVTEAMSLLFNGFASLSGCEEYAATDGANNFHAASSLMGDSCKVLSDIQDSSFGAEATSGWVARASGAGGGASPAPDLALIYGPHDMDSGATLHQCASVEYSNLDLNDVHLASVRSTDSRLASLTLSGAAGYGPVDALQQLSWERVAADTSAWPTSTTWRATGPPVELAAPVSWLEVEGEGYAWLAHVGSNANWVGAVPLGEALPGRHLLLTQVERFHPQVGYSEVVVTVTARDGWSITNYKLQIRNYASVNDSRLLYLSCSAQFVGELAGEDGSPEEGALACILSPEFAPNGLSYEAMVSETATHMTLHYILAHSEATVRFEVQGASVGTAPPSQLDLSSGALHLNPPGEATTVHTWVTAHDLVTTSMYTVRVSEIRIPPPAPAALSTIPATALSTPRLPESPSSPASPPAPAADLSGLIIGAVIGGALLAAMLVAYLLRQHLPCSFLNEQPQQLGYQKAPGTQLVVVGGAKAPPSPQDSEGEPVTDLLRPLVGEERAEETNTTEDGANPPGALPGTATLASPSGGRRPGVAGLVFAGRDESWATRAEYRAIPAGGGDDLDIGLAFPHRVHFRTAEGLRGEVVIYALHEGLRGAGRGAPPATAPSSPEGKENGGGLDQEAGFRCEIVRMSADTADSGGAQTRGRGVMIWVTGKPEGGEEGAGARAGGVIWRACDADQWCEGALPPTGSALLAEVAVAGAGAGEGGAPALYPPWPATAETAAWGPPAAVMDAVWRRLQQGIQQGEASGSPPDLPAALCCGLQEDHVMTERLRVRRHSAGGRMGRWGASIAAVRTSEGSPDGGLAQGAEIKERQVRVGAREASGGEVVGRVGIRALAGALGAGDSAAEEGAAGAEGRRQFEPREGQAGAVRLQGEREGEDGFQGVSGRGAGIVAYPEEALPESVAGEGCREGSPVGGSRGDQGERLFVATSHPGYGRRGGGVGSLPQGDAGWVDSAARERGDCLDGGSAEEDDDDAGSVLRRVLVMGRSGAEDAKDEGEEDEEAQAGLVRVIRGTARRRAVDASADCSWAPVVEFCPVEDAPAGGAAASDLELKMPHRVCFRTAGGQEVPSRPHPASCICWDLRPMRRQTLPLCVGPSLCAL